MESNRRHIFNAAMQGRDDYFKHHGCPDRQIQFFNCRPLCMTRSICVLTRCLLNPLCPSKPPSHPATQSRACTSSRSTYRTWDDHNWEAVAPRYQHNKTKIVGGGVRVSGRGREPIIKWWARSRRHIWSVWARSLGTHTRTYVRTHRLPHLRACALRIFATGGVSVFIRTTVAFTHTAVIGSMYRYRCTEHTVIN